MRSEGEHIALLPVDKLTESRAANIAEYKKRKRVYDIKRVGHADLSSYLDQGWNLDREMKRGVRVNKQLGPDEQLENQFWILLYLLGYEQLNIGRNFRVSVDVDGNKIHKQIDVFAIDGETVVVAECKTAQAMRSRSLQKELSELDSIKRQVANAVRNYLGQGKNPKILWFFVTSRLRWSENDLARAKEKRIHVVREQELRYFMEIAKALGRAARYQFHAEFLEGEKIPALGNVYVPASRFKLGGRIAYSFSISAKDLLRRAFVNHRDLRDPSGAPTYQRLINPGRIKKIAEFLDNGGYFANSALINFHDNLRFDIGDRPSDGETSFGRLYLPDSYKSCWIIDGQHRIYGAAIVSEGTTPPMIPVVAFEKLPPADEANLFATINREQKPVQKRLLDELDGELKWASSDPKEAAGAIAARALDILRSEVLGPFEDRISLPGMRGRQQPLTVPQLKLAVLQSALIGRVSSRDGHFIAGPLSGGSPEATLENLCSFLTTFFQAVRDANPDRWASGTVPLCHNVAVPGLIRLAAELVDHCAKKERIDVHELPAADLAEQVAALASSFLEFCRNATDEEFNRRFPITFGSGGPRRYFLTVAAMVHEDVPNFEPEGLAEYLSSTSKERTEKADQAVKWIVDALHGHVVAKLRAAYGNDFFERGVKNKDIKIRAYSKRAETDPDGKTPLENYLDVIELKKIVEASENWPLFKETLDIPLPGQQKGLAKYLKWIDEFNDIRKTFAHPYNRAYSDDDVSILEYVENNLKARLVQ